MTAEKLVTHIESGGMDSALATLYTPEKLAAQRGRVAGALREFAAIFGADREVRLFSAPGRTEIGGNHTDHQRGRVLAAAVNLDVLCVAAQNDDGVIRIQSAGYPRDEVNTGDLALREGEKNKAVSLIRGIAARCRELGFDVGGFDAYTTSDVLSGSGLSSSAAFEIAVGTMLSHLYNAGAVTAVQCAQIGQYAENHYFGKPSGLMDQMASSVGGFVAIDFADPLNPVIDPVSIDLQAAGYTLCVVDTKGDHADLTHEYAAIPVDMGLVAAYFGKQLLREVDSDMFFAKLAAVRQSCGDRAVLRAIHFFADNERVRRQTQALREGDIAQFLQLVVASGRSSQSCLQNVFACSDPQHQGLSLALALSERMLAGDGAWRVHGGGFAGTIQAFVPNTEVDEYVALMERVFGANCCYRLSVRPCGGVEITESPDGVCCRYTS